jgi:TP901 family phage tail tape measure protein
MDQALKLAAIITVIDKLTGPTKNMAKAMSGLQSVAEKGKAITEWGNKVGVAGIIVGDAAAKLRGALESTLEPTMKVEDRLAELGTVITPTMGSVEDAMESARKASLEWAGQHKQSADQFLQASYMMASAGLKDVQAIEGTKAALAVATATLGDGAVAANLLATVYNNLGNKTADVAGEMRRLGDITTKTQNVFQIKDLAQLNEGLKYGIPTARQYGIEVAELYTVIGALNTAGLQGGMAGTAFAATMRNMTKAAKQFGFEVARNATGGIDFIRTLENMRAEVGDFSDMTDATREKLKRAFGDEGIRAVSLLLGETGSLADSLKAVENATGVTAAAQERLEGTVSSRWAIIRNRIDQVKMTLADALLPAVERIIPSVIALVDKIQRFVDAHPALVQIVMVMMGIGAAAFSILAPLLSLVSSVALFAGYTLQVIGGVGRVFLWLGGTVAKLAGTFFPWLIGLLPKLVAGFGAAVAAVGKFGLALLASPITWIIAGLVAVGVGIYYLIQNWDAVKTAVGEAWDAITEWTGQAVEDLKRVLGLLVGSVVDLATGVLDHLAAIGQGFMVMGQTIGDAIASVGEWLAGIPGVVADAFMGVVDWLSALPGRFYDAAVGMFDAFVEGVKSVAMKPVEAVSEVFDSIAALLPHSDVREGPLSTLSTSGKSFWPTWSTGLQRSGADVLGQMGGMVGEIERSVNLSLAPQVSIARPTQTQVMMSDRATRREKAGITIQTMNVALPNVKDGKAFVDELRKAVMELAPA